MRFMLRVWLLAVSALLLFTFVSLVHHQFTSEIEPHVVTGSLVISAWTMGLISVAATHVLYRRAEQLTRQAARDEAIAHLAGALAHELNQPLTVVISGAELMAHRKRSGEDVMAVAETMAAASHRMADIVVKLQNANHYSAKPYVGKVKILDLDRTN